MIVKILTGTLIVLGLFVFVRLVLFSIASRTPPVLGVQDGRLVPCPRKPNCVSSEAQGKAHGISPLSFSGQRDEAVARARQAIASMNGRIVETDDEYLRAEFSSRLFRFVDDLELLWNPGNRQFDVRSASRVGTSDLGANRKRVEELRRRLGPSASSEDLSQDG